MTVQYDGSHYLGWQTQPCGRTVQDVVEERLSRILDHSIRVHGAGRTDRGVHARGQEVTFETANPLPLDRLCQGMNALLPEDIAVVAWRDAPPGFHARHSARRREYAYQIWRPRIPSPFVQRYVWHLHRHLDLPAMRQAATHVLGRHDFTSFCAAESMGEGDNAREVFHSDWEERRELWIYRIRASAFLHHMVRILVGTMVEVGKGMRHPDDLPQVIAARDRRRAGPTAPAQGLFLERVEYEEED